MEGDDASATAAAEDSNDSAVSDVGDESPGDDSGSDTGGTESEEDSSESTGDEGDLPDDSCDSSEVEAVAEILWEGEPPFPEQKWGASFPSGVVLPGGDSAVFADATGENPPLESDRIRVFEVDLATGGLKWEEYPRGVVWQGGPMVVPASDGDVYLVDQIAERQLKVSRASGTTVLWAEELNPFPTFKGGGAIATLDVRAKGPGRYLLGGGMAADTGGEDGSSRTFLRDYQDEAASPLSVLYQSESEPGYPKFYALWDDSFTFSLREGGDYLMREFSYDGTEFWADAGEGNPALVADLGDDFIWRAFDSMGWDEADSVFGIYQPPAPDPVEVYRERRCGLYIGFVVPLEGDRVIFASSEFVDAPDDPRETVFALFDLGEDELLERRRLTTNGEVLGVYLVEGGESPELLVSVRQQDEYNRHSFLMRVRPFE